MAVDFGRYQFLKKIASGGMGQVFLARTAGSGGFEKLLVIKRILPQLVEDDEFIEMFFDEARIAARLNHPNLVQIFDLGEAEGSHYLAMEYVAGEDLRRVDKKARGGKQPIPPALVLRIIADAAAGLDYAHKARDSQGKPLNLIHRDVSPQNILVGFDGAVKLIDFGVAKAAGRMQHTASGILKGKYPYMSPEQADGREMDGRSDLFALGIVCWELLTEQRLFKGDSDMHTLRLVKDCLVPPPSQINKALPPGVDQIVLKALAKEPKDRFKDAGEFRLALENLLISNSLPASSAHLSAYMHGLYAERIEHEADPQTLDELAPNANIEPGTTPVSRPSNSRIRAVPPAPTPEPDEGKTVSEGGMKTVSSRSKRVSDPGVAVQAPRRETVAIPAMPGPRKKLPLFIGGATALVLLAVAVPLFMLRPSTDAVIEQPKVETKDPVKVVEPTPNVNPEPEKVERADVLLELRSDPAGALVDVGGKKLGMTPLSVAVPADGSRVLAKLTLDGFEPNEAMFSKADGPSLTVQLQKKKPLSKKETGKKPPPNLGIKTGR